MPKSRLRTADLTPALVPLWHYAAADVPNIGTTPVEIHSIALPSAGTYQVELYSVVEAGTLTGTRNATWTLGATNFTSCTMTPLYLRTSATPQVDPTLTANNHTFVYGLVTSNRVRLSATGLFVVSAAAVLAAQLQISGELCTLKVGSFLRARKHA